VLVPPLLDAWAEALQARSKEASGATRARPHWEDAVDMGAAAPPFRRNPSSWSHRIKVAVLAAIGAVLAAYMSLYQLHLTASVWDPVFVEHQGVLTSNLGDDLPHFHVPTPCWEHWRTARNLFTRGSTRAGVPPWIVASVRLERPRLAAPRAARGGTGLVVKSWCFPSRHHAISLLLAVLSAKEVYALHYLWRVTEHSGRARAVWNTFWGRASEPADRAALPKE
jgi:hypothetical protein